MRRHVRALLATGVVLLLGAAAVLSVERSGLLGDDADPAAAPTGAPQPRVDGNRLVDARDGSTFVPRGVNWSVFEYALRPGLGAFPRWRPSASTEPHDAHGKPLIAAWGANTVRLP